MIFLIYIFALILLIGIIFMYHFAYQSGYDKAIEERDDAFGKMYNTCFDICYDIVLDDFKTNLSSTKLYSKDQIIKELEFLYEDTENINGYERRK